MNIQLPTNLQVDKVRTLRDYKNSIENKLFLKLCNKQIDEDDYMEMCKLVDNVFDEKVSEIYECNSNE